MADSFTHLHVHTEFSMLDGAARVDEVVAKAASDGQPAIGITDHGNMYGILDFYQACKKHEIGCVIGSELYMAYDHRTERPPRRGKMDDSGGDAEGGRKAYYHLTALAENNVGYKNLIQLSSRAYLEGYYMKPRCLLAGQEIVTATGVKNIEDIEVGDLVLTHRGRLRPVTQVMSRHHRGEVFGVALNNRYGRVTWMTGEHPVLVHGQDGVNRWVQVQDIDAGRRTTRQEMSSWASFACLPKLRAGELCTTICTSDHVDAGWQWNGSTFVKETMRRTRGATRHYSFLEESVELDYEFGFFVGLFAAEGHTYRNQTVTISIHEDEVDLAEAFRLMVKKLTRKEAVVRGRRDRPEYRGIDVQVGSAPLASLMRALCGAGANNKHLPSFTFDAPQEFQQGLLDGVLAGDGHDYGTHSTLCQTSRDLAWQVRMLAATLADSFASVRTCWDGHPNHAPTHGVNISATSGLRNRRILFDDDYVYRPISEIERKDHDGLVYNIEVAEDHSYVSDFAIHNCDWEMLSDHSEGIIATTGCLGGQVLQELLRDDYAAAVEKAARLQDIFGRDNLFVEIQDHEIPEQKRTNPLLYKIAKQIKAPLLATNDSHYTHQGDAVAHDALLCVQTGSLMSDPDRFKFHGDQHFLKTAQEMRSLFREVPESCDNTLWIAERAKVEIEFGKPQLPNFPLPEGFTDDAAYLEHLTFEGARKRWGEKLPDAVVERLAFELKVIGDMGFSSYFLIVWDLIRHARDKNIRVGPGRGSAAGCAVAYTLWITDLDPIKYDLLFERFLNPSRISMPDIDMDFDSRFRDEMIRYAAEMYGRDHVAQIVTFSTIKARAAVRDAARVLGYPYIVGDKVAKAMPPLVMGRDTPLAACLEPKPKYEDGYKMAADLRAMYDTDPDAKSVIDVALGLEGLRRQDGIHAAAVVITKEALTEYLPIQRKPEAGKPIEEAPVVTQYEMHGVEDLGLLKMDFLGLRNLDVITDTIEMIREIRGIDLDIDNVDLADEPTYELLRKGDTIGVFQLEGGAMRTLMRSLAPTGFEDVAALVALYRPGPMSANMHNDYADRKNGRKPIEYLHPDAEEILGSTQGLMIFQESVMRIAQKFAGYSLAEADNLRKACLPAGSLMLTKKRGYVPIEKVMRLVDRRVQTIDTTSSATRFENVADVWSVGRKPVYRLATSTGYTIEATSNHPFLVGDEWRELGTIEVGDLVGVAARTDTEGGSKVTDAEVDLSALLISEGYIPDVRTKHRNAHFCNTDPELLDTFRTAFAAHFGYAHAKVFDAPGVTELRLKKHEVLALEPVLGRLGLSGDKTIPLRIINASLRKVERFLGLYFCADGWSDRSGAHFASKSRDVCLGLKRMLLRCGVTANLNPRDIPGYGRHWTLSIADSGMARRFARRVEPHLTSIKIAKLARWMDEWPDGSSATNIGIPATFLAAELRRRAAVTGRSKRDLGVDSGGYTSVRVLHRETLDGLLYSERLEDLRRGDLVWDTVVSVDYVGERECFDFEMANVDRPYAVVEDFLVHNCGKKSRELIQQEREKFIAGCETTGYGGKLGKDWFDIIEPFADYAFNKSHSYGYGLVAYQTAYLKANYPVEYFAALLTSVKTNLDKAAIYLNECRQMGIPVLVPDVNRSMSDFVSTKDDDGNEVIPFGLSAVRNVGAGLVELLVTERDANGPFADFYDFCDRVDITVLNKRTIESLIKAGGFDSMGHPRQGLLAVHEQIIDRTVARRRKEAEGQFDLFSSLDTTEALPVEPRIEIPDLEFEKKQRLAFEKEMLGLYVSDHPLMGAEASLRKRTECSIAELEGVEDGQLRTIGGLVTNLQRKWTKKGDLMAVFILEDLQTSIEVMVFPKTMQSYGHLLEDDAVVVIKGRVDTRDDQPKIMVMEIDRFEPITDGATPVRINLTPNAMSETMLGHLKGLLSEHPGESQVFLHLGQTQVLRLPDQFCVDASTGLVAELRVLLGPDAVLV